MITKISNGVSVKHKGVYMKSKINVLGCIFVTIIVAILIIGCDDGSNGSNEGETSINMGNGFLGNTLVLSGRVYWGEDGKPYNNEHIVKTSDEQLSGEIKNGILSFSVEDVPSLNDTIGSFDYYLRYPYVQTNFSYSSPDVQIFWINGLHVYNEDNAFGNIVRDKLIESSGIYYLTSYIYVDEDVTINGEEENFTYDSYNIKFKNIELNFKKGWNGYCEIRKFRGTTVEIEYVIGNPESLQWSFYGWN